MVVFGISLRFPKISRFWLILCHFVWFGFSTLSCSLCQRFVISRVPISEQQTLVKTRFPSFSPIFIIMIRSEFQKQLNQHLIINIFLSTSRASIFRVSTLNQQDQHSESPIKPLLNSHFNNATNYPPSFKQFQFHYQLILPRWRNSLLLV